MATWPPAGPIAFASWAAASSAPLMLFVSISGTSLGCGEVPESIETTLIPAFVAPVETSFMAVLSVAAYTRPFTPWAM